MDEPKKGMVRSVSRALALLRCFGPEDQELSLGELAERSDIPKSTAVRLLDTLTAEGMVTRSDRGRTYAPGFGLIFWGRLADLQWSVPAAVREEMGNVARESGESVTLYTRIGDSRVPLAHVPGTQSLRHVITPGEPMTLSAGATSWILLRDARPDLVERAERELRNRRAGTSARRLIDRAVKQGYAYSSGEREVGVAALSVPLVATSGRLLGALAIGGPTTRLTEGRVPALLDLLEGARAKIVLELQGAHSGLRPQ